MEMISKAIVDGSLRALAEQLRGDERNRVENGVGNRAERRRQQAIERKEDKKKNKARA